MAGDDASILLPELFPYAVQFRYNPRNVNTLIFDETGELLTKD
jgi:hypothetical protein